MGRLILIGLVLLLTLVGALAVVLFHFWGWAGLAALPVVILLLLWIAKKLIGRFFRALLMMPFKMKSVVLQGAKMEVHSIVPVAVATKTDAADLNKPKELKHYFEIDLTITPREGNENRVWEPGEMILASGPVRKLPDLEAKQVGQVHDTRIWNGSEFGPDDPGKYSGPQRLKQTFAVKPGTSRASLQYYVETLGQIDLPAWNVGG